MQHTQRVLKAAETLAIIESGGYTAGGQQVGIGRMLEESLRQSVYYKEEDFGPVMSSIPADAGFDTTIRVANCTVLAGAEELVRRGGRVGCLNFASARNPGGGFLKGALAQEESLAMSSTLYAVQSANFGFYEYNRGRKTLLYSDRMIYGSGIAVFRDEAGSLLPQPYLMDVLTSPAVNVGAIRNTRLQELPEVEAVTLARMDKVLALFRHHGAVRLLLGAWGCGVFQNDPVQMAAWFGSFLLPGGKYAGCFEDVLFAVYDRSADERNLTPFRDVFGNATTPQAL